MRVGLENRPTASRLRRGFVGQIGYTEASGESVVDRTGFASRERAATGRYHISRNCRFLTSRVGRLGGNLS